MNISDVKEHLDELFNDTVNINREIRKLKLTKKSEEAMSKNVQKIGEQILVLHSRLTKEQ